MGLFAAGEDGLVALVMAIAAGVSAEERRCFGKLRSEKRLERNRQCTAVHHASVCVYTAAPTSYLPTYDYHFQQVGQVLRDGGPALLLGRAPRVRVERGLLSSGGEPMT